MTGQPAIAPTSTSALSTDILSIDGKRLSVWQACRRRYGIERLYKYLLWHPTTLFSYVMRRAVLSLSQGLEPGYVADRACGDFMSFARQPGLDTKQGTNNYLVASDLCACIRTICEYLSREGILSLKPINPKQFILDGDPVSWRFMSNIDESGQLHRWIFTDYIDEDSILIELHKWQTFGDLAVSKSPMIAHFVSLGRMNQAYRRQSPWCRIYRHPSIAKTYKFRRNDPKADRSLSSNWIPTYYSDLGSSQSASNWVDQMLADDIFSHALLIRHVTVKEPTENQIKAFYRDLRYEQIQIEIAESSDELRDPFKLPMSRPACDVPYACPHQYVCFTDGMTPEKSGLYEKLTLE